MTITQHELRELESFSIDDRVQFTSLTIATRIVETVVITICIVGLIGRFRGSRFPSQPGHWVALSMATSTVPITLSRSVAASFGLIWELPPNLAFYFHAFLSAIWGVIFLVLAKRSRDTVSWRLVYLLLGFASAISALSITLLFLIVSNSNLDWFDFVNLIAMCIFAALAVTAITAIVTDRVFSIRRDWAHWLSVLLPLALGIVMAGWVIVSRLIAKF